jgi:hypothetical protein
VGQYRNGDEGLGVSIACRNRWEVLSHAIEHFGDNNTNLIEIGDTLDSKDVNAENKKAQNVTWGTNKNQAKQAKKVKKT